LDFIATCRKFIEIDSTSENGSLEIVEFAAQLCRTYGLECEIQKESFNGTPQANLIARFGTSRPDREFMLQTHLDTSEPGNFALWTKTGANPFNASIYQDQFFGLGAANSKLDFLCKLQALHEVGSNQLANCKLPAVLVGTYGEENGMPGAVKLIRQKKVMPICALVGEPTNMQLVQTGKGFAGVEIQIPFTRAEKDFREAHNLNPGSTTQSRIFIGKAAHSTVPHLGESAATKMLAYLAKLPEGIAIMEIEAGQSYNTVPAHAVLEIDMVGGLRETIAQKIVRIASAMTELERQFANFTDDRFFPPYPTLNLGLVRTFEDFVLLKGCCRLPANVSNETYQGWMTVLKAACEEVGAQMSVNDYKQPFFTPLGGSLINACQGELSQLNLDSAPGAQSAANEANVFSRFGVETIVIGPGQGVGNTHAPNEYVNISQLNLATRFYKGVIERVCL